MPTALAICPHADDAAAFFGGTLAKFADEGWKTVLVRVTDDRKDSVGSTIGETIAQNTKELAHAAAIMGVAEIVELGYETDCLADVSEPELRERIVYLFRKYRPYAVFTFDPFGVYEGNLDHIVTAQAVEEAFWVSCFDLHYRRHLDEGLQPFAVCERWYYGRDLPGRNYYIDITDQFNRKVDALCAHDMMMRNLINQLRLQAETWGRRVPAFDEAFAGDLRPMIESWMRLKGEGEAQAGGLPEGRLAESFRLNRFGGFEAFIQTNSEPIPGAEPPVPRPGLDLA
jgi:N-acetylglucosamine malate deacetylase 1